MTARRGAVDNQEPVGGWLCVCGRRRGGHNTLVMGQPSLDGKCPGFEEEPGQRRAVDPHERHRRMTTSRLSGECLKCLWERIDYMCAQGEYDHVGRAGRRFRQQYTDAPGFERPKE